MLEKVTELEDPATAVPRVNPALTSPQLAALPSVVRNLPVFPV